MSKSLILAEKPSVAKDIAKALGGFEDHKEYLESDAHVVSWAVGHLVEFKDPDEIDPRYQRWKLEDLPILPAPFELKPKSGASARLALLKKLLNRKDVAEVVNACDAGREGELIFRELLDYFEIRKPTRRLWLQSMTPEAIRQGFRSLRPGSEYDRLGDAARCRSEADWLIGMNATRALTRRMKTRTEKNSWSAGRVQTPTLAMLVDREVEILAFRTTPFWRVQGRFMAPVGASATHEYEATWFDPGFQADPDRPRKDDWITDEAQLEEILRAVRQGQGVAEETRKPQNESAPPLFDLTTLQREANRRFGMSARGTLSAAQRLYEGYKLITYPRTDSRCLPSDYRGPVHDVLQMLEGSSARPVEGMLDFPLYGRAARYLESHGLQNQGRIFDDKGISDHFAIIPTTERPPASLRGDEARVYNLIVRRFLAAFYPQATWVKVERVTRVAGHSFRTRSRHLAKAGWYEVYGRDAEAEKDRELPALAPGQDRSSDVPALNLEVEAQADETRPPARVNEGRLLSLMENAGKHVDDAQLSRILHEKGLGTPATRAEIIEALITRQYAERTDRALKATTKGILLIDMLRRIEVARLASPELTGDMEFRLHQVEEGKHHRDSYMAEIQDYTIDIVERTRNFEYTGLFSQDPPLGTCPLCQRHVREQARFYACEGNSGKDNGDCSFIIWKDRAGRYLDRRTVEELLRNGQTEFLEGFTTTRGQAYRGRLRLKPNGEVDLEAEGAPEEPTDLPVSQDPVGRCPFHEDCLILETPTHYRCQGVCVEQAGRKSGLILPRMVCQREITREELQPYLDQRRTDLLENFISRFGKPFKAILVLKDTGKHGFEFPPREPSSGRRGGARGKAKAAEGEETQPAGRRSAARKAPATRASSKTASRTTAKATTKAASKEGSKAAPRARVRSASDGSGKPAARQPARPRKPAQQN